MDFRGTAFPLGYFAVFVLIGMALGAFVSGLILGWFL